MNLLIVLPRRSKADRDIPNSVDLCVHDLVSASRYRTTSCIVAERVHGLFDQLETADVPHFEAAHTSLLVRRVTKLARERAADLIVVHQHFQIAARLARTLPGRVVFHAHGFYKSYPSAGLISSLRRRTRLREVSRLIGLVHVSDACLQYFAHSWPEVLIPQAVVHNGLDIGPWMPEQDRAQEIICVGRCVPEKGILEASQAVARVLQERPGWRARFTLSEPERDPAYMKCVRDVLESSRIKERIMIELNVPWSGIKERYERAAIALVPSMWREPFGRTALEAHAGGAALVSSGSGGLREVSGSYAQYVDPSDTTTFADTLIRLIDDPVFRTELADGGARHVRERFSIEAVAATNDAFYEALLMKQQGRA